MLAILLLFYKFNLKNKADSKYRYCLCFQTLKFLFLKYLINFKSVYFV